MSAPFIPIKPNDGALMSNPCFSVEICIVGTFFTGPLKPYILLASGVAIKRRDPSTISHVLGSVGVVARYAPDVICARLEDIYKDMVAA